MATLVYYTGTGYFADSQAYEITYQSSTRIEVAQSYGTAVFHGTGFYYDSWTDSWYGTVTAIEDYDFNGHLVREFYDFSSSLNYFYQETLSYEPFMQGSDLVALYGNSNDYMVTYGGDDIILSYRGSKIIDAGAGIDTVVYEFSSWDYGVYRIDGGFNVQGGGSNDTLISVERLSFDDGLLLFDDNALQMYRLYEAAFNREPDNAGLDYWIYQKDLGLSLQTAAQNFIWAPEFTAMYGANPTNETFINQLYLNVLDRPADQPGYDYWNAQMANGVSQADVLVYFSESAENVANTADVAWNGVWVFA